MSPRLVRGDGRKDRIVPAGVLPLAAVADPTVDVTRVLPAALGLEPGPLLPTVHLDRMADAEMAVPGRTAVMVLVTTAAGHDPRIDRVLVNDEATVVVNGDTEVPLVDLWGLVDAGYPVASVEPAVTATAVVGCSRVTVNGQTRCAAVSDVRRAGVAMLDPAVNGLLFDRARKRARRATSDVQATTEHGNGAAAVAATAAHDYMADGWQHDDGMRPLDWLVWQVEPDGRVNARGGTADTGSRPPRRGRLQDAIVAQLNTDTYGRATAPPAVSHRPCGLQKTLTKDQYDRLGDDAHRRRLQRPTCRSPFEPGDPVGDLATRWADGDMTLADLLAGVNISVADAVEVVAGKLAADVPGLTMHQARAFVLADAGANATEIAEQLGVGSPSSVRSTLAAARRHMQAYAVNAA